MSICSLDSLVVFFFENLHLYIPVMCWAPLEHTSTVSLDATFVCIFCALLGGDKKGC